MLKCLSCIGVGLLALAWAMGVVASRWLMQESCSSFKETEYTHVVEFNSKKHLCYHEYGAYQAYSGSRKGFPVIYFHGSPGSGQEVKWLGQQSR